MRAGTGWIDEAGIADQTCYCKECRASKNPRTTAAYIYIITAAHLVYDQLEAARTKCQLVFDSAETPGFCKDVVTLTDYVVYFRPDSAGDTCRLMYYTHNTDLVRSLQSKALEFMGAFRLLYASGDIKSSKFLTNNGSQNVKQEGLLQIVVSHPHGCCKHVNIDVCHNRADSDAQDNQSPQASNFCAGSSGARVIVLGWESVSPVWE